ncbi:hypothetical protein [Mucilaginibacter ginkgonis]|uniref:Uncharacterized protein n=1 Tax=Mucilaginibacter ginkgonis TaxID=2682091 RepID=A0A6I4HU47_9SPHI|nr:hypothetical protein [Mucilaginibacter ginkgonis]QQL50281.1 hypothetical protein GO620_002160 [Mucilaginibacter ginkgonis]
MIKRKAKRRAQPDKLCFTQHGFGYEMPPDQQIVLIYFDQQGLLGEAGNFFRHYENCSWKSPRGKPYRNWKVLATDWIFNHRQASKLLERQIQNRLTGH